MTRRLLVLLLLTACHHAAPNAVCDRLRECSAGTPTRALYSLHEYCASMTAYQPPPDDPATDLAAIAKRSLEECAAKPTCPATNSCLTGHRCTFFVSGGDADTATFQCM